MISYGSKTIRNKSYVDSPFESSVFCIVVKNYKKGLLVGLIFDIMKN